MTEKNRDWVESDVKIHRKYCGILSYEELLTLIEQIDVQEVNRTQGMLTIEYGHMPAISMSDSWDGRSDINIYVSPVFDDETELKLQRELGVLTQMARDIIIDTTTQPHFDKIMKLLYKADDYDALERLGTLIETEIDIQPMLPLVA
jgi:hypothetical protein